jgi:hypothetical protein
LYSSETSSTSAEPPIFPSAPRHHTGRGHRSDDSAAMETTIKATQPLQSFWSLTHHLICPVSIRAPGTGGRGPAHPFGASPVIHIFKWAYGGEAYINGTVDLCLLRISQTERILFLIWGPTYPLIAYAKASVRFIDQSPTIKPALMLISLAAPVMRKVPWIFSSRLPGGRGSVSAASIYVHTFTGWPTPSAQHSTSHQSR